MKNAIAWSLALSLAAALGAGCLDTTATLPVNPPVVQEPPKAQDWQPVSEGAERAVMAYMNATTSFNLIVYRLAPQKYRLRVAEEREPHTMSGWSEKLSAPALVINGSYFNDDYSPSGLLKVGGKRVGRRQFDLDKSGAVVIVSGTTRVLNTARESPDFEAAEHAVQSFPLLVSDGKAAVNKPGQQRARRTFIGQDKQGFLYIGVVPEPEATLYELSQALMSAGVDWTNVLNLDGGPSSGLAANLDEHRELINSQTGVPNVVVVESY